MTPATIILLAAVAVVAAAAGYVLRGRLPPAGGAPRAADVGRRRMLALLELSNDFVAIADAEGRVLYLNHAGRRMLGKGEQESIARAPLGGCFVDQRTWSAALTDARERGFWSGDVTVAHADLEVQLSLSLIAHRDGGEVEFYSTIGRDVTQKRQLDRLKSELISTVSHELRTPLTAIHGAVRLLEAGGEGIADKRAQLLSLARSNTERMRQIVDDLLDLGELDSGTLELERAPLRPDELACEALARVAAAAEARGVAIAQRLAAGLTVDGDRERLVQVLVSLLDNAIKYSETHDTVARADDGRARFAVRDEGPGVDEQDFSRVFHTFSRLDGSDTREQYGTGLGLAISRAIVEQHGGEIGVESRLGQGSEFYFCLRASVAGADAERALREPGRE